MRYTVVLEQESDGGQIRAGTLRRIVADAGMTVDQFIQLLRR
jgi:hypothetical protein